MRGSLISPLYLNYLLKRNRSQFQLAHVVITNHHANPKEAHDLSHKCLITPDQHLINLFDLSSVLSPLPYKLPTKDQFEAYIRNKYNHQTPIILFDETIHLACRAWFTFRYFGFHRVYVLDGGYHNWHQLTHQRQQQEYESITLQDEPKDKFSVMNTHDVSLVSYLKTHKDKKGEEYEIVDARDKLRFDKGHIPGSINIEFTEYLNADRTFKSNEELAAIYKKHNVDINKKIINTCQTGKLATIALMAQELLKKKEATLYDGSYTDYSIEHPHR